jgi:hypothetical protein
LPEAEGRQQMADHLVLHTEMTVDAARALLAVAPKQEDKKAPGNLLEAAMDLTKNPNVGADNGGGGGEVVSAADRILSDYTKFTGRKVRQIEQGV